MLHRTFDVLFNELGEIDLQVADREITSPAIVSEEDSNPRPIIYEDDEPDPEEDELMEWEFDPESKPIELEPEPEDDSEE
ncbi:hypothetical protein NL676_031454 [Syzygium grande]|nr:hypothetical protein NL676_031454 [Syzygium grande]